MSPLFSNGFCLLTLLFFISSLTVSSPRPAVLPDSSDAASDLIYDEESIPDAEFWDDFLFYFLQTKKNINTAGLDELLSVPGIDSLTASRILFYRQTNGFIFSADELRLINGLSIKQINSLKTYFLAFDDSPAGIIERGEVYSDQSNKFTSRIRNNHLSETSPDDSPYRFFNRFEHSNDRFYLVLNSEKDPFEKNYFDYYSGSAVLSNLAFFDNLLIGDYKLHFGYGLVLGNQYLNRKGIGIVQKTFDSPEIRPNRIADENKVLRGFSADLIINKYLSANLFFSYNYRNCRLDSSGRVISFYETGYFTNQRELGCKRNTRNIDAGTILRYRLSEIFSGDILLLSSSYDRDFALPVNKNISRNNFYSSLSNKAEFGVLSASSEMAFRNDGAFSVLLNTVTSLTSASLLNISLRNYGKSFLTHRSSVFAENSFPLSEKGFYGGLKITTPYGQFSSYIDLYLFETTKSEGYELSGTDFLLHHSMQTKMFDEIRTKLKFENKEDITVSGRIRKILNKNVELRTEIINRYERVVWKILTVFRSADSKEQNETGKLFSYELSTQIFNKLSLSSRFTWFDTESFSSGIYLIEKGSGNLSDLGIYYGQGVSLSIIAALRMQNYLSFSAKFRHINQKKAVAVYLYEFNADNMLSLELNLQF